MTDKGPSSVTIEEAVAKMIGFDILPELTHLDDAIAHLANLALEDYFNAQEDYINAQKEKLNGQQKSLYKATIHRYGEEHQDWQKLHSQATKLFVDIEKSIDKGDPLLHTIPSDTCRTRLTTQSIYAWAKKRHDILIPEWKEFRGSAQKPYHKLDKVLLEGQHLFEAIVSLVDELLCRDWSAWKGNTPDLAPPTIRSYFSNGRTHVDAISSAISETLTEPKKRRKGKKDPETNDNIRTITTHVKGAIKCLTSDNQDKRHFTKRQFSAAYRTLIGLYRLLDENYDPRSKPTVRALEAVELQFVRFTSRLASTSRRIRNNELNDCLMRAARNAYEKKL